MDNHGRADGKDDGGAAMIGTLAKLLGVDKWLVGAVAALAVVAALWGVYAYIDARGYERAAVEYKAEIAELKRQAVDALNKEVERQASVQNQAKAREAARIAEMQAANEDLQSQIQELQREADEDPSADVPVLGAPSVRRINKIR